MTFRNLNAATKAIARLQSSLESATRPTRELRRVSVQLTEWLEPIKAATTQWKQLSSATRVAGVLAQGQVKALNMLREPLALRVTTMVAPPPLSATCAGLESLANSGPNLYDLVEEIAESLRQHPQRISLTHEEYAFAPCGDGYFVAGFGDGGFVPRNMGFQVIEHLLHEPGRQIPLVELLGLDAPPATDRRSRQPAMDTQATRSIQERLHEIDVEMERARKQNDEAELGRLVGEREQIVAHAAAAVGLGGRPRDLNSFIAKHRPKVHSALKRAYAKLRKAEPPMRNLADHFEKHISADGATFVYDPAPIPHWSFHPFHIKKPEQ